MISLCQTLVVRQIVCQTAQIIVYFSYDFRMKTMFGSSLNPVVCRTHVLFTYSGVQHILCCVFVLFFFVLCTLCCEFLWIVYLWLPLWYSLTLIQIERSLRATNKTIEACELDSPFIWCVKILYGKVCPLFASVRSLSSVTLFPLCIMKYCS